MNKLDCQQPLTREACLLWLEALRSGKYPQGKKSLMTYDDEDLEEKGTPVGFCCLGVYAKIIGFKSKDTCYLKINSLDPSDDSPYDYCVLPSFLQEQLAEMNDGTRTQTGVIPSYSFLEIADYIEKEILPLCLSGIQS